MIQVRLVGFLVSAPFSVSLILSRLLIVTLMDVLELSLYWFAISEFLISLFSDLSAWDCSAWVRTYALFLEERLECFRVLKYDIEAERLPRPSQGQEKVFYQINIIAF